MEREEIESLQLLAKIYYKILKINLTKDKFTVVKINDNNSFSSVDKFSKISDCLKSFISTDSVHLEDLNAFKIQTSLFSLQNFFKNNDENFRLKYRHRINNEFRWVLLEIIKAPEYSDTNQIVILYLKDIHDSYVKELENQRELEMLCNSDMLTGLNNFYAYKKVCLIHSQQNIKDSIGIIFADLNGLKIVNDMEGHSAGDKLICTFADILKSEFGAAVSYRISGDEFLVIIPGTQKREFINHKKNLEAILAKDEIPMAAVGWSWVKKTEKIEDVVKVAEYSMYDSKHEFYKKHPEYKRSIVEENYKKDVAAIIRKLAFSFGTLGVIDVKKDHYTLLKDDDMKGLFLPTGNYSSFFKKFVSMYLGSLSTVTAEKLLSLENMKDFFKTEDSISCVLQTVSGKWLQITVNKTSFDSKGNLEKVVFFTNFADKKRSKRLDESKQIMDEYQVIDALSRDYLFVSMINIKENKVRVFKNSCLSEDILELCKNGLYTEATKNFADKYVLKEDRESFLRVTDLNSLGSQLKERNQICTIYRTVQNNQITYCEASYMFAPQSDFELIYGVKDITSLVNLEHLTLKNIDDSALEDVQYL